MPKIKITQKGPYVVSDNLPLNKDIVEYDDRGFPLKTNQGETLETPEEYHLCRCGNSKNKPFCDGSHKTSHFDGTENPKAKQKFEDQADRIDGPDLILKDNTSLCAGAGFCDRAGGAWNLTQNSNLPQAKAIATEEACCCPSGRLVAVDKLTGQPIEPKLDPSIGLSEDGPLCVKGGISIESADGSTYETRNRVALCCCGKSKNKPFCDGSHFE